VPSRRTGGIITAVAAVAVIAAGAVALRLTADEQPSSPAPVVSPSPTPTLPEPAAAVLPGLNRDAPVPTTAGIAAALERAITDPRLGPRVLAAVVDPLTGTLLYGREESATAIPASTTKIVTGAAVLAGLGPDRRFTTRVVRGAAPDEIILVGGGDPLLTAVPASAGDTTYPTPTRLTDLAARTVSSLRAAGVGAVRLRVDDSLFTGPAINPAWEGNYVGGAVAPISALTVDSARALGGGRELDPPIAAGNTFATMLGQHGIAVTAPVERAVAPAEAEVLGEVRSAPTAAVVERMLLASDNDASEALARHVALASGQPASFDGVAVALPSVMQSLGLDVAGLALADGSGLSRSNAIPPVLLVRLLALATTSGHSELRPVLTGLPVGGFTGTLELRFDGEASASAGEVRAKTGTLNGVHTLAGTVEDVDGRLLTFAVMADNAPVSAPLAAQDALDEVAAVLAACGCR
jgi:D-alanyl-D-alanine carboxypeptidase/D-alanyl-D-alanine-endopeptidase (penicillin-binding protein 4)